MPTTDKSKNRIYVKKHKDKKKQAIGVEAFNRLHALEFRNRTISDTSKKQKWRGIQKKAKWIYETV